MKRVMLVLAMLVMVVALSTVVNATTPSEELTNFLKGNFNILGKDMQISDSDLVKVERYLADNPVTESEVTAIKSKVNEMVGYVNSTDASSLSDLTVEQKKTLISKANETAAIVDLSISVDSKNNIVTVYKDGKVIDSISFENKLVQTGGNEVMPIIITSILAIIAIASVIYIKRNN